MFIMDDALRGCDGSGERQRAGGLAVDGLVGVHTAKCHRRGRADLQFRRIEYVKAEDRDGREHDVLLHTGQRLVSVAGIANVRHQTIRGGVRADSLKLELSWP